MNELAELAVQILDGRRQRLDRSEPSRLRDRGSRRGMKIDRMGLEVLSSNSTGLADIGETDFQKTPGCCFSIGGGHGRNPCLVVRLHLENAIDRIGIPSSSSITVW